MNTKASAILGYGVVAAMWVAPSAVVNHLVGPMEARWFFIGGISFIILAMVFSAFNSKGGNNEA